MKKKYHLIILFLILVMAAIIRFNPSLNSKDYWYDEAFTGILLKQPFPEMNQMIFDDVHPPLYYWLAKPWSYFFDYSPEGIRFFSSFLGLLIIISVYWICEKMFNKRTGLLAASITAFSPFAIQYSQEARMYALFGLLMLWAVWFFYRALEENKIKDWLLWGVFGGLSFYTHYLSLFFFVMFFLAFIVIKKQKTKDSFKDIFSKSKNFWMGAGIIFLFFFSWIKIFISHMSKGNLGWIDPSYLSDVPKTLQIFFFGHPPGTGGVPWSNELRYFFDSTSAGLLIFSLILVFLTIAYIKKVKKTEFTLLAIMSLGTLLFLIILSHLNIKLYVARYFMPAAIVTYILLSALIIQLFKNRWVWIIAIGVYCVLLFNIKEIKYNMSWNELYQNQEKYLGCCSYIITSNPFDYTTARYYFGEDRVKYYNKNNPTEDFSGWVVVGNENRLADIEEIKKLPQAVIVANDCGWEELNIKEKMKIGEIEICKR